MHRHTALFIVAVVGVLLVAGCAHTIHFKAVDAATGHPLAGVVTSWRQDSYDLLLGAYHFGPTNLPPSREDGVIVVDGIYKKKVSKFIFSRSGYATVYGGYYMGGIFTRYSGDSFSRADHTNSVSGWSGFILEEPLTSVSPTNGFIVVRMSSQ